MASLEREELPDRRSILQRLALVALGATGATTLDAAEPAQSGAASDCGFINVKDYGAVGDGVANDTTAFQQALSAAGAAGGGIVLAPRGNYRINGTLAIPGYVTLQGVFTSPTAWSQFRGTTLLAYSGRGNAAGTPFITLKAQSSCLSGVTIFYPEQNDPFGIVPYPWTIRGGSAPGIADNLTIQDVLIVNPYNAVDFGTHHCGRHLIRGLYGQPLKAGILVDRCLDVGRIENVHFWPFWRIEALQTTATPAGNGRALILKRSDWQIVHNFFCFGYHVGIQFVAGLGNKGTNGQFSNVNLDAMNVGLDLYATHPYGLFFSNFNCVCTSTYGQPHRIGVLSHANGGSVGPLSIQNGSFWGNFQRVIDWHKGGPLQLAGCNFRDWAAGGPAIRVLGGRATLQGNFFQDARGKSVQVGNSADRVLIVGNQLAGNPIESSGPPFLRLIQSNL